jgi:osmotically-inducible protein OsmY
MNDKQLRQDVIDELDFEPSIDSADIGVQAENGVVTLTGHVPGYTQKLSAERAVWRVKGVKAVVEKLQVHYGGKRDSDEEIARRSLDVLKWDSTVPSTVQVTVQDGWLSLGGSVQWQYQRRNAELDLLKLAGVKGINNNITIESKPPADPKEVRQKIEQALKRNAELEAQQIRVDVREGGTVMLDGHVDSWRERSAAERAAWSAPGVRSVVDHLTIG